MIFMHHSYKNYLVKSAMAECASSQSTFCTEETASSNDDKALIAEMRSLFPIKVKVNSKKLLHVIDELVQPHEDQPAETKLESYNEDNHNSLLKTCSKLRKSLLTYFIQENGTICSYQYHFVSSKLTKRRARKMSSKHQIWTYDLSQTEQIN